MQGAEIASPDVTTLLCEYQKANAYIRLTVENLFRTANVVLLLQGGLLTALLSACRAASHAGNLVTSAIIGNGEQASSKV
jgi:hypothetical protein